jgi:putative ABC transport system permease protein
MKVFNLIFRNLFRHKLRSALTVIGIAVAVMSFAMLRTVISAWYIGVEASAPDRLITRHSFSFIFPLPLSYYNRISSIPGVTAVSYATWFQGVYIDEKNFFARMAVDDATFFSMYSEYIVPPDQLASFQQQRSGCIVGRKLAEKYKLGIGDAMPVDGDIYPGRFDFVVKGIYRGRDQVSDETQMFFHWKYLDETLLRDMPGRAGYVGWYIIRIADPANSARISSQVDALFRNSPAETKTETEKAFTQGFISMASAIINAMQFISYIIIGIILLVLANTMVMTARERVVEYAVLKTLGFRGFHIMGLIAGESMFIACLGGSIGLLITFPVIAAISAPLSSFFPIFVVEPATLLEAMSFAILVGIAAAIVPVYRAMNTTIVAGLRHIG